LAIGHFRRPFFSAPSKKIITTQSLKGEGLYFILSPLKGEGLNIILSPLKGESF
jgi:hypothetical protein